MQFFRLLLLVLTLPLLFGCAPPGPRALLEGKRLIEQGKYSRAMEKLRSATALLATNAQAWNYLGLACHYGGQGDEAERAYKRALSLDHDLTEAHYNLACLWLAQNKPEKTEAAKTELLAYTLRRGNSVEGLIKLGVAQVRARELAGAEKSFNDALKFSPQNPEALNGAGLVRLQRGRPDEAAKYFRAALKERSNCRPALLNLAIVAQQYLNDRSLAIQKYREYLALKPPAADTEAIGNIVRQLEQELHPAPRSTVTNTPVRTNANLTLPKALPTNFVRNPTTPKIAETPTNPARMAVLASNSAAVIPAVPPSSSPELEMVKLPAEPVFKTAEDISNAPPENQNQAILTERMIAKPTPSVAQLQSNSAKHGFLERINPLNLFRGDDKRSPRATPLPPATETPQPQPLAISEAGGTEGSENSTVPAVLDARYHYVSPLIPNAGNRSQAQKLYGQGVEAQRANRAAEAIKAYRDATQADGTFYEAHYNLGLALSEAGDLPGALVAYENALAIRPESLDARYNFSLTLKRSSYFVDAANELEKLLTRFPDEPRANLALGNLYAQQLNQPAKARERYLRVLDTDAHNPQAGAIRYWLAANPP